MLVGHRVILRPFRRSDLDGLYDLSADVRVKGEFWPLGCISEPRWFKQFDETSWWSDDFKLFLITDRDGRRLGQINIYKPKGTRQRPFAWLLPIYLVRMRSIVCRFCSIRKIQDPEPWPNEPDTRWKGLFDMPTSIAAHSATCFCSRSSEAKRHRSPSYWPLWTSSLPEEVPFVMPRLANLQGRTLRFFQLHADADS